MIALHVTACESVTPAPRSIEVSQQQLTVALTKRFPYSTTYLDLFDIRLDTPSLKLLPESNRLASTLALSATDRVKKP